jgi:hypothetical protein
MRINGLLAAIVILTTLPASSHAATKSWNGGFSNWNDGNNWSPLGVPLSADDVLIGNLVSQENDFVNLDINDTVGSLSITDGMVLDTNGFTLLVNGDVTISGQNQVDIFIYPSRIRVDRGAGSDDFDANNVTVTDEAGIDLDNGGILEVDNVLNVDATSSVSGGGVIDLEGSEARVFILDGVLDPTTDGMTVNQNGTGLIDLDGTFGNGRIAASVGKIDGTAFDHITINGTELADDFNGDIVLTAGGFVAMNLSNGWTAGAGSTISFGGFDAAAGQPGVLSGGDVTFDGTTITVSGGGDAGYGRVTSDAVFEVGTTVNIGTSDSFELDGATTINGGTFTVGENAHLDFDGATTVYGGVFNTFSTSTADGDVGFNGASSWRGNITVNGVARVNGEATVVLASTVNANVFDMDGTAGTQSIWNINSQMTINADAIETVGTTFNGTINTPNGPFTPALTINLTDANGYWTMDGVLNLKGNDLFVVNRINGSDLRVTGEVNVADTNVGISADTIFTSSATTNFAAISANLLMSGETAILAGATFNGFGKLSNVGSLRLANGADTGSVAIENGGTLTVGNSAGQANTGPFTNLPTGTYVVEIGGTTLGTEYDNLDAGGVAFLAGTLEVDLINNFVPSAGDTFEVLSYTFKNGQFDALIGEVDFGPGFLDFLHPLYVNGALLLYAPVSGDANLDGSVDGLDYLIWAEYYGDDPASDPPGAPENGDLNNDNVVDGLDYLLWAANYGMGPNDAVAIPEPASGILLTVSAGFVGCVARRRTKRRTPR